MLKCDISLKSYWIKLGLYWHSSLNAQTMLSGVVVPCCGVDNKVPQHHITKFAPLDYWHGWVNASFFRLFHLKPPHLLSHSLFLLFLLITIAIFLWSNNQSTINRFYDLTLNSAINRSCVVNETFISISHMQSLNSEQALLACS